MQRINKISISLKRIVYLFSIIGAMCVGYLSHNFYYRFYYRSHFMPIEHYNRATVELNTALAYLAYEHYQQHTQQQRYHIFEQVIVHCSKSIALEPSASAYYHLGIAQRMLGQPRNAIVAFNNAIRLDNKQGNAYLHLAATLVQEKQFDQAITIYEHMLKQQPTNTTIKQLLTTAQQSRAQALS